MRRVLFLALFALLAIVAARPNFAQDFEDGSIQPLLLEEGQSLAAYSAEMIMDAQVNDEAEHILAELQEQTYQEVDADESAFDQLESENESEAEAEQEAEAETEGDAETDAVSDVDTSAETEVEVDAESGAEVEVEVDADTGIDADAEVEVDGATDDMQLLETLNVPEGNPTYVLPYPPVLPGHYSPLFNPYTNVNPLSTPFANYAAQPGAHPGVASAAAAQAGALAAINGQVAGAGGAMPYYPYAARHPVVGGQLAGNPVPWSGYAGWINPQNLNSAGSGTNAESEFPQFLEVATESTEVVECNNCSYQ